MNQKQQVELPEEVKAAIKADALEEFPDQHIGGEYLAGRRAEYIRTLSEGARIALATRSDSSGKPTEDFSGIAEAIAEGGYWNTCSGCHNSEDGQDVGEYPFSETFRCKMGAGCHECGGLGAIWFAPADELVGSVEPVVFRGMLKAIGDTVEDEDPLASVDVGVAAANCASIAQSREASLKARISELEAENEKLKEKADKFMWQVRDTCKRAEAAEARVEELLKEIDRLVNLPPY